MDVDVDVEHNVIVLRPVGTSRREDAWAFTPEHNELLARAHTDSREGQVRRLTEDELESYGG